MNKPSEKPRITFLFSDTGGGHRASSEAIIEAIQAEFGDAIATEMVDFLKDYAPKPFNYLPDLYPEVAQAPKLWKLLWELSDGRPQARLATLVLMPYVRKSFRKMARDYSSEMLVSVHPLANSFVLKSLGKNRPPFATVVTDMVSTHALWFDKRADLIFVATEMARRQAIKYHMPPDKIHVVGQPVSERSSAPLGDKRQLRAGLGWPQDRLVVLTVGGGEGMGPLHETARAIDRAGLEVCQVIVTGRNAQLEAELKQLAWELPTFIYGFTREMHVFMRAADVLVTKAGPGTIAEALNACLPMILYTKLPGQEDGNVTFVESTGVGIWAPEPQKVVEALRRWNNQPHEREKAAEACCRAARPDAARKIARILAGRVGLVGQSPAPDLTFSR